jgi:hypothetical protein
VSRLTAMTPKRDFLLEEEVFANSKMDEWHQLFNGVGAGRRIAPPLIGIIRRGAKEDVLAPQR